MTDSAASDADEKQSQQLPPYAAYSSVKSAIQVFKDQDVIPNRVDRSVWGSKFSGTVTTQILTALKFLGLINAAGAPQPHLRKLVDEIGTEGWGPSLRQVLEKAYAPIFALNLQKASASEFNQKFKEAYGAEGETGRKCTTFFLNAAREASVQLSPYLIANAKPRVANGTRKPRKPKANGDPAADGHPPSPPPPPPPPTSDMTDKLLEKFPPFDPAWPDELKQSWFAGFNELMNRTKGKRGG